MLSTSLRQIAANRVSPNANVLAAVNSGVLSEVLDKSRAGTSHSDPSGLVDHFSEMVGRRRNGCCGRRGTPKLEYCVGRAQRDNKADEYPSSSWDELT